MLALVEIRPVTRTAELVEQAYNALLADELPDKIADPDDLWECGYCPVRRVCEGQETCLAKAARSRSPTARGGGVFCLPTV